MRKHRDIFQQNLKQAKSEKHNRSLLLRYIKNSCLVPLPVRQYALLALSIRKNYLANRTRVQLFCLVTGRIRSTMRDTHTSRLVVGAIQREGNLVGYFQASW